MAITVSRVTVRLSRFVFALKYVRGQRAQVVRLAVELAGHLREVVADVAQVLARAARQPGQLVDRGRSRRANWSRWATMAAQHGLDVPA